MKLQEFKEYILERWGILLICLQNKIQSELTHIARLIEGFISPLSFCAMMLFFAYMIYSKVSYIAGYSRDEMIFFLLLGQIGYFFNYYINALPSQELINDVRSGGFDLILVKPLPSLYYMTVKNIPVIEFFRTGIPNTVLFGIGVNWSNLNLTLSNFLIALLIMFLGILAMNAISFLISYLVFTGKFTSDMGVLEVIYSNFAQQIPFEGVNDFFKTLFISVVPIMISTNLCVSVALGKFDAFTGLLIAFVTTVIFTILKIRLWKVCLKSYASASS